MKNYKIVYMPSVKMKKKCNSMQEADEIYVLDTGSTDKTVSL